MPAARRRALLAVLACGLLAGCTVGPSERPPVAVRGESVAGPQTPAPPTPAPEALPAPEPQNTPLDFRDCTDGVLASLPSPPPQDRQLRVECAAVPVPTDPADPLLGRTPLGVIRVGLPDGLAERPPLLAVGDSAGEPSALHAAELAGQGPVGVLERFTLIGLDRRGTGTDALGCAPPAARSALVDADPLAADEADLNAQLEQARRIVQDCYLLQPGSLQTISTTAAAGDVEALRAALGVARLSAIGVGDGATALATWARGHAGAVGRLVLDGPPDPGATEPEATAARAAAAESAFDAFATSCTARPDCPLGSDPRAAVSALVEQLRGQPLVADDGRRLTAGKVVTALLTEVDEPRRWDVLAAALAAAGAGDPTGVLGLLDPLLGPGGRFDSRLAVSCNDSAARRLTPPEVAELAQRWRAEHPLFGVTLARGLLACSPWPVDVAPGGPGTVEGTPPVLVIGAAAGTRSTLEGSRAAAAAIENARFLSWQGTGAGAYPRTPCVGATVEAMLLDGVVPADGILCPP